MKAIIGKFVAVSAVVAALGFTAVSTQAAPPAIQSAGIREYHHHETRIIARHLEELGFRVREAMNFGWTPVGGAIYDGHFWVQVMVRE